MTKSALFGFPILALFPKKMTHDKNRSLAEILWKFYNARRKARISGIERIDNLFNWPNIIHFKVKDKDTNITNETTTYDTIGGNFIIEIPYSKKHNINVLKEPASRMNRGFFNSVTDWSVLLSCHKALLNTYNEDQRSNHA